MGDFRMDSRATRRMAVARWARKLGKIGWVMAMSWGAATAIAASAVAPMQPCRIEGVPNEVQCGFVRRPLDPARPDGPTIDVHFVVVPAMARNKQTDAVLLLAGGPGQSAIDVAPAVLPLLSRLNNRRDLVFIDQRGTGRSAPLQCADESHLAMQQLLEVRHQLERLNQCRRDLAKLPYGDLRFFTTEIAMQDFEAIRLALGVPQWNLVGASYGTRAALEYQRQFPGAVRRTVIDGVAPPDMVLPASFSLDGQAALDALWKACEADTEGASACAVRFPGLREKWAGLLARLPQTMALVHPTTGAQETVSVSRETVLRMVRTALYVPAQAAALPAVVYAAATRGEFAGLIGLASGVGGRKSQKLAMGMHFSVICAEDVPRLANTKDAPGADFGGSDAELYKAVCKDWPIGSVGSGFYTIPPAQTPVLVLSGGADPATPPRHGARVAQALGAKAQHVVIDHAGHGVMSLGCMRDVVTRFVAAASDESALPQDASCARNVPRPVVFLPIQSAASVKAQP